MGHAWVIKGDLSAHEGRLGINGEEVLFATRVEKGPVGWDRGDRRDGGDRK